MARGFGCGSSSEFAAEVKPKAGFGFSPDAAPVSKPIAMLAFRARVASAETRRLSLRTILSTIRRHPSARTSPSDRYRRLSSAYRPRFAVYGATCAEGRSTRMQCAVTFLLADISMSL
jgi:hypothetical protein